MEMNPDAENNPSTRQEHTMKFTCERRSARIQRRPPRSHPSRRRSFVAQFARPFCRSKRKRPTQYSRL